MTPIKPKTKSKGTIEKVVNATGKAAKNVVLATKVAKSAATPKMEKTKTPLLKKKTKEPL